MIPLRASTPVTALRLSELHRWGHGDGLGLVRGRIAHRALEAQYAGPNAVTLDGIAVEEAGALGTEVIATLTAEVQVMLERFAISPIGVAIGQSAAEPRFELPFAWNWDGVPVHGQLDLLYRDGEGWCVVDFKTDRVSGTTAAEVAEPYVVQIALYAKALEAATGTRPRAGLLFLQTGDWYEPEWSALEQALEEARERIDGGLLLDPELPEDVEGDLG